jgi:hypothetical protein
MKCATCRHWSRDNLLRDQEHGGRCQSGKLSEDYFILTKRPADALVYDYQEGGGFWTGPEFGCVHWRR